MGPQSWNDLVSYHESTRDPASPHLQSQGFTRASAYRDASPNSYSLIITTFFIPLVTRAPASLLIRPQNANNGREQFRRSLGSYQDHRRLTCSRKSDRQSRFRRGESCVSAIGQGGRERHNGGWQRCRSDETGQSGIQSCSERFEGKEKKRCRTWIDGCVPKILVSGCQLLDLVSTPTCRFSSPMQSELIAVRVFGRRYRQVVRGWEASIRGPDRHADRR